MRGAPRELRQVVPGPAAEVGERAHPREVHMVSDERRVRRAAGPHRQDERLVGSRIAQDVPVAQRRRQRLAAHALLEQRPVAEHPVAVAQQAEEGRGPLAAGEERLVDHAVAVQAARLVDHAECGQRVEEDLSAAEVAADRGGHGPGGRARAREVVEHAELGGGEQDLGFLEARDDLEESVHRHHPRGEHERVRTSRRRLRRIAGRARRTVAAQGHEPSDSAVAPPLEAGGQGLLDSTLNRGTLALMRDRG